MIPAHQPYTHFDTLRLESVNILQELGSGIVAVGHGIRRYTVEKHRLREVKKQVTVSPYVTEIKDEATNTYLIHNHERYVNRKGSVTLIVELPCIKRNSYSIEMVNTVQYLNITLNPEGGWYDEG